jgi:lipoprotein NlpD
LARWNRIASPYTIYVGQKITFYPSKAKKYVIKAPPKKHKTLNKHKDTRITSNLSKIGVQLSWQWPLKTKKLVKNKANFGVKVVGTRGELVRSGEKGKVVYAGSGLKGYGNLIIIKHNEEFLSAYGLNKRLLVKEGVLIKKGQAIAEIGLDEKLQYVLFFEIRQHGKPVDVTRYLPR